MRACWRIHTHSLSHTHTQGRTASKCVCPAEKELCIRIHTYVHAYMHTYIHICMYILYIYIYYYMHIYIHTQTHTHTHIGRAPSRCVCPAETELSRLPSPQVCEYQTLGFFCSLIGLFTGLFCLYTRSLLLP